jgi:hypothetical protein
MANSNWSFDEHKPRGTTPPSDRAVPQAPRQDRIPEPTVPSNGWDALRSLFDATHPATVAPSFSPLAELQAEGLVDIFVHELDILDCPACFAQHFKLGEKCRKHDA